MALITGEAAAKPFLDGAYGNKEGCIYANTGESSGADIFFLLNDEGITTAASYCEFKSEATKSKDGFTLRMQCESEGETGDEEVVRLTKTKNAYTIHLGDGSTWGPLPKCR